MPSDPGQRRLRFFVFTCRGPASDFRLPLVRALREQHETWYIWLKRRPAVSGPGSDGPAADMSLPRFLLFMLRFRRDDAVNIYFNSTNTYFPTMSVLLRLIATGGVWCLDMHDDLRYHNVGFARRREDAIIWLLGLCSHVTVHAAPTLQELFPNSRHLGNASHLRPLARDAAPDNAVLIIASFDERLDFDFLSRVVGLRPDLEFHLHGWTRTADEPTMALMTALRSRHRNIHYHGAYSTEDLPAILASYRVSLAPYLAVNPITRYIDPLRFYHCLNAGLEVVSTGIPQARYMDRWIHVVDTPEDCVATLDAVLAGAAAKQPGYTPITWEQRVARLTDILRDLPLPSSRAKARTPRIGWSAR